MAESTNTVHVGSTPAASYDVRLVKVEGDVAGLKTDIGEIKASVATGFKDIITKVEAKGAPNHFAIGLIITVLLALLGWGWALFGNFQGRNETAIGELKSQIAKFETRDEIDKVSGLQEKIADLKAQIVSGKVERLASDVVELQAKIVPLSTHQELWATQHAANQALTAQIEENRRAIAGISAPQDTISRIYKRLDDVEGLARGRIGARGE